MCQPTTLKTQEKKANENQIIVQQQQEQQQEQQMPMHRDIQGNQLNVGQQVENKEEEKRYFSKSPIIREFKTLEDFRTQVQTERKKDILCPGGGMSADSYVAQETTTAIESLKRLDHRYKNTTFNESMPETVKEAHGFRKYILTDEERNQIKKAKNLDMDIQASENIQEILKKADQQCANILGKAFQRENDLLKLGYGKHSKEERKNLLEMEEQTQVDGAVLSALWSNQYQNIYYGAEKEVEKKKKIRVGGVNQIAALAGSTMTKTRSFDEKNVKKRKDYKEAAPEQQEAIVKQYKHVFNIYQTMRSKGNEINQAKSGVQNNSLLDAEQVVKIKYGNGESIEYKWNPQEIKHICNLTVSQEELIPVVKEESEDRKALLDFENATAEQLQRALEAPAKGSFDFAAASSTSLFNYVKSLHYVMERELWKFCAVKYNIEKNDRNEKAFEKALNKAQDCNGNFGTVRELTLDGADETVPINLEVSEFTQSLAVQQMRAMCDYIKEYANKKNTVDAVKENRDEYQKITLLFSAVKDVVNSASIKLKDMKSFEQLSEQEQVEMMTNLTDLFAITTQSEVDLTEKGLQKINDCEKSLSDFLEKKITNILEKENLKVSDWKQCLAGAIKDTNIQEILSKNEEWAACEILYNAAQKLQESATEYKDLMEKMAERDFKIQYYNDVQEVRENLRNCSEKLQNSTMNEEEKKLAEKILSYKAQLKKIRDQDDPETDKQKTEEELIAQGQEIYDTLSSYDTLISGIKRRIQKGEILLERPQARKLIDMAYDLKADYTDRIFEEKKEVLACYEGSLILRDMPANKSYKDQKDIPAAKKVMDLTDYYEDFQRDCRAFLDRYASVEGTSFYVGKVKTQLEFVTHKIRKAMGATAEDLFNNLDEETKKAVMEPLTKISYGEKEKELYKTLMEDNKDRKGIALDQYSVKDIMQVVYGFALTQHTFDRAGMDGEAVLKKSFAYEGVATKLLGKFEKSPYLKLNPSMIEILKNADQKQVKTWVKDAIGKYNEILENVYAQYGNSIEKEKRIYAFSFINQTQLGTQGQVLAAIVNSLDLGMDKDPDVIELRRVMKYTAEQNQESRKLMGEDNLPKMQQDVAWETYVRLNQQTGENKEKEAELAAKAYNEKEKEVKKNFESSELKKAIGALQLVEDGKETSEFRDVRVQILVINEIETKDLKEKEIDGVRHIVRETDDDYPTLLLRRDEAYKKLAVLVRTYITKKGPRGNWFRSSRGIKRLTAMKNLFEALKNYYALEGDYEDIGELKDALNSEAVEKRIREVYEQLTNEKARAKQAEQRLIADKQTADEYKEALAELKNRYNEATKDGKKVTLEDLYSSNKGVFGRILIQKDRDLFVNAGDGAKFYTELKAFENQLKDDKVKEIWKGAKKLKKECYGKDISQLTELERFELWSKCQEFIKENSGEQIPAEAKQMLKEIKVLSENYVSQKEYERMLSEMEKDRVRVSEYAKADNKAYVYVDKFGEQRDPEADMLLLVYKYKMFLKGAKKISNQEHLSKEEKGDKNKKISDFEQDILAIENKLKNDVFKNDKNKTLKTAAMKGARRNLDQRLSRLRTLLDNTNFVQRGKQVDQDFRTALKDATEEINFYLDTFSDLKTINGKKKTLWMYLTGKEPELDLEANDLMEYYSAQRDNLRKIMAQTAISNVLQNESDLLNRGNVDVREGSLKELTKNNVDKNGKVSAKKGQDSKQMQACLKFILEVEVESKKLGGIKKLVESQPEMAAELQKQMAFRAEYENSLSGLSREQKDNLREAMNNIAGDYLQVLKKEMKNVEATLTMEDERMNYYYIGFGSAYDHASEFLHLADKWDSGYESGNSKELKKLIRKIDRNTKEVMALYHFKDEDATIRETVENIKVEFVKSSYSTDKVVKQRDHDFAVTMRNLANIRLGSAQDLKINKEIKNQGVKYNQEGYKNLKVRNDFYIKEPLFGYVLWGTETYSLDELILKLNNESMRYGSYETVEPLLNQLMDLKQLATAMTSKDFLAKENAKPEEKKEEQKKGGKNRYTPEYFKTCVENLNTTMEITYAELHDHVHKMGDQKLSKKNTKFSEAFYKAWKSYYPSLQKLSEQMEGYIDRTHDNEQLKKKLKKFRSGICGDYSSLSKEQQEREYLRVLKNLKNNEYAESSIEHIANANQAVFKSKYIQWFENYSFKMAQDVAEKFRKLSNDGNNTKKYACLADYYDFMAKIEEYHMQGAIDEKVYTATKAVVEREVSKQGLKPLSEGQIIEMRAQFAALNELDRIMGDVDHINQHNDLMKAVGLSDARGQKAKGALLESVKVHVEAAYNQELNKYKYNKGIEDDKKFMERFNKFSKLGMKFYSDNRVSAQATVKEEIEKKRKEFRAQGFDGEALENKIDEWLKGNELCSTIMAMRFRWWNPTDWAQKIGNMFV